MVATICLVPQAYIKTATQINPSICISFFIHVKGLVCVSHNVSLVATTSVGFALLTIFLLLDTPNLVPNPAVTS